MIGTCTWEVVVWVEGRGEGEDSSLGVIPEGGTNRDRKRMYGETLDKDINVRKKVSTSISIRITRHSNESRPIISGVSQTPVSDLLPSNMIYIVLHWRLIP
uniref:Uncharacterized protein n=1 Tax=Vespula pensylvanica TaxID=30213 RepID=A0A834NCQ0_VESPE|nr:hypothetical protein H0235_015081 [Vespula pensylvanica]